MEDGVENIEILIFAGNEECQIKNKLILYYTQNKSMIKINIYEEYDMISKLIWFDLLECI